MIITSKYHPEGVEIKEFDQSKLIPAYEIKLGFTDITLCLYDGKLYAPKWDYTTNNFVSAIKRGIHSSNELSRLLDYYIALGNTLYIPAIEPFYWLEANGNSVASIIRISYTEKGNHESRRRFKLSELEEAIKAAEEIISLVYGDNVTSEQLSSKNIVNVQNYLPAKTE